MNAKAPTPTYYHFPGDGQLWRVAPLMGIPEGAEALYTAADVASTVSAPPAGAGEGAKLPRYSAREMPESRGLASQELAARATVEGEPPQAVPAGQPQPVAWVQPGTLEHLREHGAHTMAAMLDHKAMHYTVPLYASPPAGTAAARSAADE